MKQKKSQSHVEIILSFTLFLSTVLIIFLFLNPLAKTNQTSTDLENIKKNIIKETSETIGSMSVILKEPAIPGSPTSLETCYDFPQTPYIDAYKSNFIEIEQDPRKYTLYFSEEFPDNLIDPINKPNYNSIDCPIDTYTFGAYAQETIITYDKLETLITEYNTDYNNLKTTLQTKNDFRLTFKNLQDHLEISDPALTSNPKNIPQETNVQAKEFPIRIIKDTGEIQEIILNIQTW
ncbi:hypothetical protein HOE04_00880 [archaeon]|jgi:hypothetical protein|nr:hypothetical protein [archaeon]